MGWISIPWSWKKNSDCSITLTLHYDSKQGYIYMQVFLMYFSLRAKGMPIFDQLTSYISYEISTLGPAPVGFDGYR